MAVDMKILAELEQQNRYLRALIAVLARGQGDPIEAILAEFGFGPQEIGRLVNKKPDAVRMLVKRHSQAKNNTK